MNWIKKLWWPKVEPVILVTGESGGWVTKKCVGFRLKGERDGYESIELLRKHHPEHETFFKKALG